MSSFMESRPDLLLQWPNYLLLMAFLSPMSTSFPRSPNQSDEEMRTFDGDRPAPTMGFFYISPTPNIIRPDWSNLASRITSQENSTLCGRSPVTATIKHLCRESPR
jgi:hypothetical protein